MTRVEMTATRGILLAIMLPLLLIAELWGAFFGFIAWHSMVEHSQPGQGPVLVEVILGVVGIFALIGMWLWRRPAVYVFAAAVAIGIAIDVSLGIPSYMLLIRLVLLALLGWGIKEKWAAFR